MHSRGLYQARDVGCGENRENHILKNILIGNIFVSKRYAGAAGEPHLRSAFQHNPISIFKKGQIKYKHIALLNLDCEIVDGKQIPNE